MYRNGCAPTVDTRDDFEDFVAFLTRRYSNTTAGPVLRHVVVWNEVASAGWMDCSGQGVPNRVQFDKVAGCALSVCVLRISCELCADVFSN